MDFFDYLSQDKAANKYNATKGKYIVFLFRLAQLVQKRRGLSVVLFWYPIFYKLFVHWLLCVELYPESIIGPGLQLMHIHSLVVHPNTIIGKNCTLRQSTTIGVKLKADGNITSSTPIIGDNVDIGANSVLLGPINIGNNAIIGAGAVVIRDIPANSIAVGNPARIL
jgi:putative colanic acid biosynthesis acetyltransferase WcaB